MGSKNLSTEITWSRERSKEYDLSKHGFLLIKADQEWKYKLWFKY